MDGPFHNIIFKIKEDEEVKINVDADKEVKIKKLITKKYINKSGENKNYQYDSKKYNDKFREKIKGQVITCEICQSKINYYAKSLHLKSKKCLKFKNANNQI